MPPKKCFSAAAEWELKEQRRVQAAARRAALAQTDQVREALARAKVRRQLPHHRPATSRPPVADDNSKNKNDSKNSNNNENVNNTNNTHNNHNDDKKKKEDVNEGVQAKDAKGDEDEEDEEAFLEFCFSGVANDSEDDSPPQPPPSSRSWRWLCALWVVGGSRVSEIFDGRFSLSPTFSLIPSSHRNWCVPLASGGPSSCDVAMLGSSTYLSWSA